MTEEKGTLAGEIHDMKDMLEVKERKVNVLQKKVQLLSHSLSLSSTDKQPMDTASPLSANYNPAWTCQSLIEMHYLYRH